jgi:hypothetical protein
MILAHYMARYRPSSSSLSIGSMIASRSESNDISTLDADTRIEP